MIVNGHGAIPEPMHAPFPDGGAGVVEWGVDTPGYEITAHPDGIFRVWRVESSTGDWAYYPIRAVGMNDLEIEQALKLACAMLDLPSNRAARRARAAVH